MAEVDVMAIVLVVDDEPEVRELVRLMLERHGDVELVLDAADADSAVAVAGRAQPDVILLDVAMPGRSGLEALPDIRRAAPNAAVFIASASIGEREASAYAVDGHLAKPFDVDRLWAAAAGGRRSTP